MYTSPISSNNSIKYPSGDDIKKPIKRESVNLDPLASINNIYSPPPSSIEQSYVSIVRTPPVDPFKVYFDSLVNRCRLVSYYY